jgi:predicted ABC-type exoprotein transport system permease subunit
MTEQNKIALKLLSTKRVSQYLWYVAKSSNYYVVVLMSISILYETIYFRLYWHFHVQFLEFDKQSAFEVWIANHFCEIIRICVTL